MLSLFLVVPIHFAGVTGLGLLLPAAQGAVPCVTVNEQTEPLNRVRYDTIPESRSTGLIEVLGL